MKIIEILGILAIASVFALVFVVGLDLDEKVESSKMEAFHDSNRN